MGYNDFKTGLEYEKNLLMIFSLCSVLLVWDATTSNAKVG